MSIITRRCSSLVNMTYVLHDLKNIVRDRMRRKLKMIFYRQIVASTTYSVHVKWSSDVSFDTVITTGPGSYPTYGNLKEVIIRG